MGLAPTVRRAESRARDLVRFLIPPPSLAEWQVLRTVRPYTMVGLPRLRTLWSLGHRAIREGIEGAFVECGSCNGGSGALLAFVGVRADRPVWLFDSFAGLPEPTQEDGPEAQDWTGACLGQEELVRDVLRKVGVQPAEVHVVKGWFEDTLRTAATGPIAVLHLDGDWYESTRTILDALYGRVVAGGFVVVDDYGHWPGCRRAVDEFLGRTGERPAIVSSDYTGVWFRKPFLARANA